MPSCTHHLLPLGAEPKAKRARTEPTRPAAPAAAAAAAGAGANGRSAARAARREAEVPSKPPRYTRLEIKIPDDPSTALPPPSNSLINFSSPFFAGLDTMGITSSLGMTPTPLAIHVSKGLLSDQDMLLLDEINALDLPLFFNVEGGPLTSRQLKDLQVQHTVDKLAPALTPVHLVDIDKALSDWFRSPRPSVSLSLLSRRFGCLRLHTVSAHKRSRTGRTRQSRFPLTPRRIPHRPGCTS